jgi:putative hydrolase of the HAD superfamily
VGQPKVAVAAITLDFGNTLVRVDRPGLRAVVEDTGDALVVRGIVEDREAFLAAWAEERERQFREEVPAFREVDIGQRAVRVLARLRGMAVPPAEARWDDLAAATLVQPEEVDEIVGAYSSAFVHRMTAVADASETLERLAGRGFALAILSNWPLGRTVDRFAEAKGWTPHLQAIVVSQRVGTIKPHPAIFRAAEEALGIEGGAGASILHVGDDWAADVVGAHRAGWRTAHLRGRQDDTPLPTSEPGDDPPTDATVEPDLVIDELSELDALVDLAPESRPSGRTDGAPAVPTT